MNQFESMTAKYFKLWQTKNIKGLSKLFDDSILLQDWDNLIRGKEDIIKFNLDFPDASCLLNTQLDNRPIRLKKVEQLSDEEIKRVRAQQATCHLGSGLCRT